MHGWDEAKIKFNDYICQFDTQNSTLVIIEARYGWRQNIWDSVQCSHAKGMKDVTDICTRNIVNGELHLNPARKGHVFNQLFGLKPQWVPRSRAK